jgi:hypothetical protein
MFFVKIVVHVSQRVRGLLSSFFVDIWSFLMIDNVLGGTESALLPVLRRFQVSLRSCEERPPFVTGADRNRDWNRCAFNTRIFSYDSQLFSISSVKRFSSPYLRAIDCSDSSWTVCAAFPPYQPSPPASNHE